MPGQLREIVGNPIFKVEEVLTLETVQSRAYTVEDLGDEPGYSMRFSLLCGDVVVEVSAKGAQPEDIFSMLKRWRTVDRNFAQGGFQGAVIRREKCCGRRFSGICSPSIAHRGARFAFFLFREFSSPCSFCSLVQ